MLIKYDVDLKKQKFSEEAEILRQTGASIEDGLHLIGEIENPVVALDQNALATLPNGQLISGLFNHPQVPNISSYDGTLNQWFRLDGTWPVTIETVTHLRGQREFDFSRVEKVLAMACGGGMTGVYTANSHLGVKNVDFSDIQTNAITSTEKNLEHLNRENVHTRVFVGDAFEPINDKYDVIIAAALPSTPGYPGLKRTLNPLFEGTDLLEKVLRDSPAYLSKGGKLILSHVSCADLEFEKMASKYGAKVENVLFERTNAYRIEFLGDQDWVDWLVERGGLMRNDDRGFSYWHKTRVKQISFD